MERDIKISVKKIASTQILPFLKCLLCFWGAVSVTLALMRFRMCLRTSLGVAAVAAIARHPKPEFALKYHRNQA